MKNLQIAIIIALSATLSFSEEKNERSFLESMFDSWFDKEAVYGGKFSLKDIATGDILGIPFIWPRGIESGAVAGISVFGPVSLTPYVGFIYIPMYKLEFSYDIPISIQIMQFYLESGFKYSHRFRRGEWSILNLDGYWPGNLYEFGPTLSFGYNFNKNGSLFIKAFYDAKENGDVHNMFDKNSSIKIELGCKYILFSEDTESFFESDSTSTKKTTKKKTTVKKK